MSVRKSWDNSWKKFEFGIKTNNQIIQNELNSLRWKKIEKRIINKYRSFKGLKVVEIGSGRGENSLLMAFKGADVTLMDYSDVALQKAKYLFNNFGFKVRCIKADIFNIPDEFWRKFDISMSFGLAEHFRYPQRQSIFDIHRKLLSEKGGIAFIAVPNAHCLPYRIFMGLAKLLGYSDIMEISFTRSELERIASLVGFKTHEIVGSSFIKDSFYFLFFRYIAHLTKWKFMIDTRSFEIPTPLDDYFGYSLVLIGVKQ